MKAFNAKRPAKVPPTESGTNAFVCSIQMDDFDKTSELVVQHGGLIALPKFAISTGFVA